MSNSSQPGVPEGWDPQKISKRAMIEMGVFGTVLVMWANVELVMEIKIKAALHITTEQACIVCGPLGGGAKYNLLSSLLANDPSSQSFIDAVRNLQSKLGRNALAHGFMTFSDVDSPWFIVSREVRNKLTVKTKTIERYFEDDFMPAFDAVMTTAGVTDSQLHAYSQEIASLAQAE
jgi:hypothetical protein